MTYGEMLDAVRQARETISNGDRAASMIAPLLRDRLRIADVDRHTLRRLKAELAHFDSRSGEWKDQK